RTRRRPGPAGRGHAPDATRPRRYRSIKQLEHLFRRPADHRAAAAHPDRALDQARVRGHGGGDRVVVHRRVRQPEAPILLRAGAQQPARPDSQPLHQAAQGVGVRRRLQVAHHLGFDPAFLQQLQCATRLRAAGVVVQHVTGHAGSSAAGSAGSPSWPGTRLHTTPVAAMSALEWATVATASGIVSTASRIPSGSTGRPMAWVTGMLVVMKLTCPGSPTEPMLITTLSPTATISWPAVRSTPYIQAMKAATLMYCTGLPMRNSDTAIGSTSEVIASG